MKVIYSLFTHFFLRWLSFFNVLRLSASLSCSGLISEHLQFILFSLRSFSSQYTVFMVTLFFLFQVLSESFSVLRPVFTPTYIFCLSLSAVLVISAYFSPLFSTRIISFSSFSSSLSLSLYCLSIFSLSLDLFAEKQYYQSKVCSVSNNRETNHQDA